MTNYLLETATGNSLSADGSSGSQLRRCIHIKERTELHRLDGALQWLQPVLLTSRNLSGSDLLQHAHLCYSKHVVCSPVVHKHGIEHLSSFSWACRHDISMYKTKTSTLSQQQQIIKPNYDVSQVQLKCLKMIILALQNRLRKCWPVNLCNKIIASSSMILNTWIALNQTL